MMGVACREEEGSASMAMLMTPLLVLLRPEADASCMLLVDALREWPGRANGALGGGGGGGGCARCCSSGRIGGGGGGGGTRLLLAGFTTRGWLEAWIVSSMLTITGGA